MRKLNLKRDWTLKNIPKSMVCCGNGIPEREHQILLLRGLETTPLKEQVGWLEKWKKRHNIVQEGDVNPETIDSWNERVKELTKGDSPRDVWNEDETGCLWKVMPEKSLSQKGKCCRGGKNVKQWITTAFFVNVEGKRALLPNPSYPCGAQYFSNEKVWNGCSAALTNLYSACYFF